MTDILTIPAASYHADQVADQPTLSASIAAILCTSSPAHARAAHPKLNPNLEREEKHEFDIGTIVHSLLLEDDESRVRVVYADDWRKKDVQALRDQARADGKTPILEKHWLQVSDMVVAAREQIATVDAEPPLLTDGKPEQTLVWQEDGVTCRARLDWLRDDHRAVDDFKTARSANPSDFARRAIYDHCYDIKAAFYLRAVKAVYGVDATFRWIVQEKTPPYALSVVTPGPDVLAVAEDKVEYAIRVWRRCLASGVWPAYGSRVATAELPGWVEASWLEWREVAA